MIYSNETDRESSGRPLKDEAHHKALSERGILSIEGKPLGIVEQEALLSVESVRKCCEW